MKKTTIVLEERDTALIFRDNGKMEMYLRTIPKTVKSVPSGNEVLTYVLSELIKDRDWVEEQLQNYELKKVGEKNG